ncbi:hypothetical protein [Treponema sp. C6A8]|nr:hypothetical protein [Treponema sp. C6A8]
MDFQNREVFVEKKSVTLSEVNTMWNVQAIVESKNLKKRPTE